MGFGSWTTSAFSTYSITTKNTAVNSSGVIDTSMSNQEMFRARSIDKTLIPYNVMRDCNDTEEHPNTVPVILAVDVTGSMGEAAVEVAKQLNVIMTNIYDNIKDVEFMIMGIGDLYCDNAPIQISQFESDIRIAEQLDKIWFEFGGGGNDYESYTAAWYMGLRHCNLDCWKRDKKGIIITMGDERINPYLDHEKLMLETGDNLEADIDTKYLYEEVCKKYDVHHIHVDHGRDWDIENIKKSWEFLGDKFHMSTIDGISNTIVDIISTSASLETGFTSNINNEGISW